MVYSLAEAENKNGVSPNVISLPAGPGSLEGLGKSFQPMLNTGMARYAVNIALPTGMAGGRASLSLTYESGYGDGSAGMGWIFGPGSISRQTDKGIPRYVDAANQLDDDHDGQVDESDEIDRFIGMEGEELAQTADNTFRARIEGSFIRYRRIADYWEAYLKDGTRLVFGYTSQARVNNNTGSKVFRWLLESSTDTNGNVIAYDYAAFAGSDKQKYLTQIRYGPRAPPWPVFYFAYLTYEDRPDWRKDYRSGFLVKTTKRLARIDVGIQGVLPDQCTPGDWNHDGIPDSLIRRYNLSYDSDSFHSFLTRITRFGANGTDYLPPISFSYSTFNPAQQLSASGKIITSTSAPVSVMDSDLVDIIDLNRDGLPDLLQTDFYGAGQTYYLNLGVAADGDSLEDKWDQGRAVASPDGLALLLRLADEKVYLADMDGDGISDLIQTPYSREVYYYRNQGDGSWSARKRMSIRDTAPPAPFTNDDVRTVDLDFDKRMDVVQSTDNGYTIWFNVAEGEYTREVRTSGASYLGRVIRFSDTGVDFADLNGDRLNDVVRIRPEQIIYCANMGHGLFDKAVVIPIPDTTLTDGTTGQIKRARLKDINGDGLADLVVERALANQLWYWINCGNDTLSAKHIITDMPTQFGKDMVTRWADINGNGTTDLIYADSTAASRITALDIGELAGGSSHPNLLVGIDNGLGIRTEITYKSSTQYEIEAREAGQPWSTTIPFPVSVIAQVKTTTGLDVDMIPGVDTYVKTYAYRDGFYEDREKAFRGFAEVTVSEQGDNTAPTRVTTHHFFTGGPDGLDNDGDGDIDEVSPERYREEDALKGKVKGVTVAAQDGFLFSEEKNNWLVKNLALSTDNIEVRFACNQEAQKIIYEGTALPETLRTTFLYDDFGNVTEEKNYGASSITGDETFTFSEYINDTDLWLLGLPQRQWITSESLEIFSETRNYYDGENYVGLALGQVQKGNLTRQEGWVTGSTYIDRIRNAYDIYGNIICTRDPDGHDHLITFDSTLHIYPVQEDIEVGGGSPDLSVTVDYNKGLGVVTSSTGFNGQQTVYGYDTFGRLTAITRPGDSQTFSSLAFSYTMADPANGLVYEYDSEGGLTLAASPPVPSAVTTRAREVSGQPGTFDTVQYVDGMGRKLATITEGHENGFITKQAVLFNAMGGVYQNFLPYAVGTAEYVPPLPGAPAMKSHYDATGRVILHINPPDKDSVITSRVTDYLPLSRTVTDENGNARIFFYDGRDRLIMVHEQNQAETYATLYAYDPLGNLLQLTDARNNVRTFEYDGLSRKTALNDPDRGRMEYSYDDAGNVIQTLDNKGQTIIYAYDKANRLLSEDYLDAAQINPDVVFYYDAPSADYPGAENTKGKLAWVKDLSGATFYSYDDRGNNTWFIKRIADSGVNHDFMFSKAYDAMDRLISNIYPDGDQLEYTYSPGSLLKSVPGLVNDLDYLPSGRLGGITTANGLTTTYTYDSRNRMIGLVTDRTVPTGSPIQDISYGFDGVGNITTITDNRTLPPGSPADATQVFGYDQLNRLIHAEGPGYGAIDCQYDKIGNMIFKGSPSTPDPQHIDDSLINLGTLTSGGTAGTSNRGPRLAGEPPGPHALTGTQSGMFFAYDDNGNMTDHNGDLYQWDFKDRPAHTTTADTTADYIYDFSGRRVIKKSLSNGKRKVVYYPGQDFEIRDGKPVKYVFAGQRRLARIEGRLAGTGQSSSQVLNFRTGWNFFSLEGEPADPAVAAVLAPLAGKYSGVWSYNPLSSQYSGYVPAQNITELTELHAQQGYMIYMLSPVTVIMQGVTATDNIDLQPGWNLISCPGDFPLSLPDDFQSIQEKYEAVWSFDPALQKWRNYIVDQPSLVNDLEQMEPGRAYWIKITEATQLVFQKSPRKTCFYHPDHLGSSGVVTDDAGIVVERAEFYPFGRIRHEEHNNFYSAYKFTGKERDRESGLDYFGARYYSAVIGRFISLDPLPGKMGAPQGINGYAYVKNNPMAFIDPLGLASQVMDPDFFKDDDKDEKSRDKGSSLDNWKEDLVKTVLALGLNVLESKVNDSGVKKYIGYALAGIGLIDMGKKAIESEDWEEMLKFGLGAAETGVEVGTGDKLALLETYQYGKRMYTMGKSAYEATSNDFTNAAKYAGITAGKEMLDKGPEKAFNSLLDKVKPPQLWQPHGGGSMFDEAQRQGMNFLNPYIEKAVGYIPLLNEEEKSMVEGSADRMIY